MRGKENEELNLVDELKFVNPLLYRLSHYLEKLEVKFALAMLR